MNNSFNQAPPRLGNQYHDDRVLRSYLKRVLPQDVLHEIESSLAEMGALSGGELYQMQLADRLSEPVLTQWDAWGERVDQIQVSPLWRVARRLAVEHGVVASAYERRYGRFSRPYQFALAYLFHPSTDTYTCPLAMTDAAARALLLSGNQTLIDRAVPHVTSRDPAQFWTSGQWMTESTGGSDVGLSETEAGQDGQGTWRLYGRKWFTSAATSEMALTLARPKGNEAGGRGLALFYVETRDENGRLQNIRIDRLKDKLGTRKLPTAELTLDGVVAHLVEGTTDGVAKIVPMLHVTRLWNSVMAVSAMRRGLALTRDYARKRIAFGQPLSQKPLYLDTLAALQAEMEAAFCLSFYVVELIGRDEAGDISDDETRLFRLLNSIVKLTTGRQVVAVTNEIVEAFGGAGYVEDTGLPMLLRDNQVFPIWEGTTNVLSLDTLRAVGNGEVFGALEAQVNCCLQSVRDRTLAQLGRSAKEAVAHAAAWWKKATRRGQPALEAGARRFSMTLGRAMELAMLVEHAQWSLEHENDGRARSAAQRFAQTSVDLIVGVDYSDSSHLANDEPVAAAKESS